MLLYTVIAIRTTRGMLVKAFHNGNTHVTIATKQEIVNPIKLKISIV